MKTIELRSLLNKSDMEIEIPTPIEEVFNIWKSQRKDKIEPLEIFYAGYILANPVIREKYKNLNKLNLN